MTTYRRDHKVERRLVKCEKRILNGRLLFPEFYPHHFHPHYKGQGEVDPSPSFKWRERLQSHQEGSLISIPCDSFKDHNRGHTSRREEVMAPGNSAHLQILYQKKKKKKVWIYVFQMGWFMKITIKASSLILSKGTYQKGKYTFGQRTSQTTRCPRARSSKWPAMEFLAPSPRKL